jgi:site-specific DNA recombinase
MILGGSLMNIAAYCRVSTEKEDQLNSLEAQKRFFTEYTQRTGDRLVRLYADEGLSGTKTKNRKEFLRLMKDAEGGLFDMVVVKDISRFARNTVDLLQNIRKLKALGIETQFLTSNMTSMGNSEFVLTIFGALAQEESANTSKRVKFGKKMNAEKGRVPNLVYGYNKTIGDYFNLTINEQEAGVIRRIYDLYINEGCGAAKISNILNREGLKTKRNCAWSQNAICRILTNELYTGKVINGKQEVTDFLTSTRGTKDETEWMVKDRPDLRIIAPEMQERAKEIMAQRGQLFRVDKERHSNQYLFSTLIKCKECGWSFRRTVRTYKNTFVRWTCSGHNGKGADSCPNAVSLDEDELINVLQAYFAEVLKSKKNIIHYVVGEFNRLYKAKSDNVAYEEELRNKLTRLEKTRQKYMDMYTDDLISREELNSRIGGMREEIAKLENELKLVMLNIDKGDQLEELIKKTFSTIEDIADVRQMTNAQLRQVIQKIEVDKDGNVDIYLRLLGDLGLDETVLINDDRTQGHFRAPAAVQPQPLSAGAAGAGRQQGPAAHPGRHGHPTEVPGRIGRRRSVSASGAAGTAGGREPGTCRFPAGPAEKGKSGGQRASNRKNREKSEENC